MSDFISLVDANDSTANFVEPTIFVEKFGRIASASITNAPLTILVGKNNTGKSYVATLLWALRDFVNTIAPDRGGTYIDVPEWFSEYFRSASNSKRPRPLEVSGERISDEINKWLAKHKDGIAKNILSLDGATIGSLRIELGGTIWLRPWHRKTAILRDLKSFADRDITSWMISWNKTIDTEHEDRFPAMLRTSATDENYDAIILYSMIVQKFISKSIGGMANSPLYVPAARTGLMLALSSIVNSSIENFGVGDQKVSQGRFTLPTIRFIQRIARDRYQVVKRDNKIVKFLQENILRGTVTQDEQNRALFSYTPDNSETVLPLYVTSSMVSELAPLLAALQQERFSNGIVFEEPEAHLHLSAQRFMARAIAKIVSDGTPVTITTHSDTFIQQINLLLQLNKHPNRAALMKRYGYAEDELLDASNVRAYEFVSTPSGTTVTEVEKTSAGIVVQSINDTLYSLAEEVFAVESD